MSVGRLAGCLLVCATSGCFRTVYRSFEPAADTTPPAAAARRSPAWRSFFLYGWLPREQVVDAAAECGGVANVREIRTRRTFGQALVHVFASSGVNVYSPWTGEVVCAAPSPGEACPEDGGTDARAEDRR